MFIDSRLSQACLKKLRDTAESTPSISNTQVMGNFVNPSNALVPFTNRNEKEFLIKVLDNNARIEVSKAYYEQEKVGKVLNFYREIFQKQCLASFGQMPSERLTATFIHGIIYGNDCTDATRYTADRFLKYSYAFFARLYNYR